MKALIFKNKVVDIVETAFEVSPSMSWVDAPEGCQTGWLIADGVISPPPEVAVSYKELRSVAYPSIADQLDTIYHQGLDAWKATILAVKEEFPK
tara:strand:- start:453 stop:734 length:282 start_codon:yes stop_codon:yes gene_type:complete